MDFETLKAFVTVAELSSFSKAAQKLHITQPAISKRIASLENRINTPLFDRIGKQVHLTPAGFVLLPKAEAILAQMEDARRTMANLTGSVSGELSVATSHHLGLHKLPPVLRSFSRKYPDVNLKFEFLDSEVAIERVLKGHCELAVVTLPPLNIDQIELEVLWPDPLEFVVHRDSEWKALQSLADLSRLPAILPDLTTYTGRLVKSQFDTLELPLHINMTTNYLETIKMMVSVGLGWSVLPSSMVDDQLRILQVSDTQLGRKLGTAKHTKRHLSNAAAAFFEELRASAQ